MLRNLIEERQEGNKLKLYFNQIQQSGMITTFQHAILTLLLLNILFSETII